MNRIFTIAAVAAALAAAPAFAQNWYAGFGVGVGNLNKSGQELTGLTNAVIDDSDKTYTVRMGYRFNPYLAIEGGYYDLGKYTFSTNSGAQVSGSGKAKSFGLSGVGILPMGERFEGYARLGIEQSEIKVNANTALATASASDKQTGATYGIGARYLMTRNLALFGEWMKNDKIEIDSYLVGVDFRF
jgi:OOP family OmpA-OmpF porin